MLRTFAAATLFLGSLSAFAAPTPGYFEVCGQPSKLGPFLGPKLIALKTPDFAAALTLIQTAHSTYTLDSLKKLVQVGVFASSPYVLADVKLQEKIEKICVMFSTGGAALGVAEAISRNANVTDPDERSRAIDDAIDTSDVKCFQEARKIEREKAER
jgi:hypothetical protein